MAAVYGVSVMCPNRGRARADDPIDVLYPKDCGFGGHTHDLEVLDVRFRLGSEDGNSVARIADIAGAAHGVGWYTNELDVTRTDRLLLPIRVFVEEGKHASAPDRDGNGVYDPRSDVNRFPINASGVRDQNPFNFKFASGYEPDMFKPRTATTQVWPAHRREAPATVPPTTWFTPFRLRCARRTGPNGRLPTVRCGAWRNRNY